MLHIEQEINQLKSSLLEMWDLVITQLENALQSIVDGDKDIAHGVQQHEKRVNGLELAIDRICENFIALNQPVASDLRYVLSGLKINTNLERIADNACGITEYITDTEKEFDKQMLEIMEIEKMLLQAIEMVKDLREAFTFENSTLARTIFKRDKILDKINENGSTQTLICLEQFPNDKRQALHLLSIMRKIERVGDQCKNIAEEIIFYTEAKVVKHKKKGKEKEK
ncbi:MAG: phosphate signaling complex protein PhoU [Saprospiraceae bacterium]